jgi:hypothetical protein
MIGNYQAGNGSPALNLQVNSKTGPDTRRDWQIRISNGGTAVSRGTQIAKVSISRDSGKNCTSTVAASSLPLSFGDIAPGSGATNDLLISFSGCNQSSKFNVGITVSANGGSLIKTFALSGQVR